MCSPQLGGCTGSNEQRTLESWSGAAVGQTKPDSLKDKQGRGAPRVLASVQGGDTPAPGHTHAQW